MRFEQQVHRVRELLAGSARPGASHADIAMAERRLGLTLPPDVRVLLTTFDGSDEATPLENGWVTFWPLAKWRRVSADPDVGESPLRDKILFADHSIDSWWYALDVGPGASRSAVHLISGIAEQPPLVAQSLSGFLQAVIDDSDVLYRGLAG